MSGVDPTNESKNPTVYLDVDHVWQEDPEHNIPENERRTICAIASMKIVVDYTLPQEANSISLHKMFSEMKDAGAQDERKYWKHSAQVSYFKDLGLTSWRRNWLAPSQDPQYFVNNEGYSDTQLEAVSSQIHGEDWDKPGDANSRMLHSLRESFAADSPVIVSVKPGFSNNKQDHQVVLNGYGEDLTGSWLYYIDPALPPEQHQEKQKISVERFFEYSKYLAIFAMKP